MRKSEKRHYGWRIMLGTVVLTAVLAVGLMADTFSVVSLAASSGKVTATSANIRKEPSTKSESVSGVTKDMVLSIKGQTTGSDGYTWYQVEVEGASGYVRSDLVEITDGSTPPTIVASTTGGGTASTPTTSTPDESLVEVTAVEPVGAKVSGGSPVRVRQNASTTSRIVTTAQSGLVLTVTGQATGTDGNQWYQVEYISNGSEVKGFVRSDYVAVDGDLVPAGSETPWDQPSPGGTEPEPVEVTKEWDTYYDGGKWHLVDNVNGKTYDPQAMINSVESNIQTLDQALSKNKTQQVIIILLVIFIILMAAVISYLIFKIRDISDSAYFNAVEQETIRRRAADRPAGNAQRTVHTVSAEKRPAGSSSSNGQQRPAGQRPAGSGNGNGQRPAGQRPAGSGNGNGQQRPAGQRPAGSGNGNGQQRPAGQRPAGSSSGNGQQRPAGQRPAGSGNGQQRPASKRPEEQRDAEEPVQQQSVQQGAPVDSVPEKTEQPVKKNPNWKPKNFMSDDEEFEFKFLDWDEKDEQ